MAVAILAGGCASRDVNPPAAKPRTGYVDFYVDDDSSLCWQIQQLGKDQTRGKILFEEFTPLTNAVVRLAFAPGEYRFAVNFLNRSIPEPAFADVLVGDGKVTPVRITLVETGKTIVENREARVGGTFFGRTGRSTRIRAREGATFRIEAQAHETIPYQPKENMPWGDHKIVSN